MKDFNANIKVLEALLKDGKVNRFKRFEYKISEKNYAEYDEAGYGENFEDIGDSFFYQDIEESFSHSEMVDFIIITSVTEGFYDKKGNEYITKVEKRGKK